MTQDEFNKAVEEIRKTPVLEIIKIAMIAALAQILLSSELQKLWKEKQ